MTIYIATNDAAFNLQLKNFAAKIGTYATPLGLTTAQVNAAKADSLYFDYTLNAMITFQTFAHNYTRYKTELRHGHVANLGGLPAVPVLGAAPAVVTADIEARFRALIQSFTHNANFNANMAQDLGISAPVDTFNPATGKPLLTIDFTAGGHPTLHYTRNQFDGVEIWKDTGTGFLKLERITQTAYTDLTALPAANQAAVWKYKAIYLYKDAVVGSYSDDVSITVYGHTGTNPNIGTTPAAGTQ
ncbi:MAG: hypothetical protein ABI388_00390 [Bacteroidia bacterium]